MHARRAATSKSRLLPGAANFQKGVAARPKLDLVPFSWQSFPEKWQFFDRFGDFVDKYPPDLAEFTTFASDVLARHFAVGARDPANSGSGQPGVRAAACGAKTDRIRG
jgi:hypothetical protein